MKGARPPIDVIYIAGYGRSGSTLLGNLLGQVPGFFHGGELRYLWRNAILDGKRCGCGTKLQECATWRRVLEGDLRDAHTARRMDRMQREGAQNRHIPWFRLRTVGGRPPREAFPEAYHETLERLYRAILERAPAHVVVDSSKVPSYAMALAANPSIRLKVVHLVRDPRAVVFSWGRRWKPVFRRSPMRTSLEWIAWNAGAEMLADMSDQYVQVQYEALMQAPRATMGRLLQAMGHGGVPMPFTGAQEVQLAVTHFSGGNPRASYGRVSLEHDREWEERINRREWAVATGLCLPWIRRYGYATAAGRPAWGAEAPASGS